MKFARFGPWTTERRRGVAAHDEHTTAYGLPSAGVQSPADRSSQPAAARAGAAQVKPPPRIVPSSLGSHAPDTEISERDRLTLPRMTALCSHDIVDVGSRSDACARWPYIHLFYSSATWALAQNQVARYPVVAQNRVCCSSLPRYFSFWRERILLFPRLRGGDGGGEPSAAAVRLRRPSDGACFGRQQHVCRSAFYLFTCIDFCVLSLHVRLHPL